MRKLILDGVTISDHSPAYLIAEIGHNHGGDLATALKMVDEAAAAGADCVKFQRIQADKLFTKAAYNEPYNSEQAFAPTYGKHREALTLSDDDFRRVYDHCKQIGVTFACTPFEEWSADFIVGLGCEVFKMASFHVHDYALIDHVKAYGQPMLFSTGKCTRSDVHRLMMHLFPDMMSEPAKDSGKFGFLHCTSEYPVRDSSHINLGALDWMREDYPFTTWGYSHHHPSPVPAVLSYDYGARIVEVHFTLGRSNKGTDHAFSATPEDLRFIRQKLDMAKSVSGDSKGVYPEETGPIEKMSRSMWPSRKIEDGELITERNVAIRAPGIGLPTSKLGEIIGTVASRDLTPDAPIGEDDYGL